MNDRKPCSHPGCWRSTYAHLPLCHLCHSGQCDTPLCATEEPPDDGSSLAPTRGSRRGTTPLSTMDGR